MSTSLSFTGRNIWRSSTNIPGKKQGCWRREVAESYRKYLELKGKLDGFSLDDESRKRELDFIRFKDY